MLGSTVLLGSATRRGTEGVHDAVDDGLASQVPGRPVGDVQSLGDWLQAGQFDDLGLRTPDQPGAISSLLRSP